MSYFDQASLVMIPSGYKTSKVYSVKPTDGSGDMSFSRSNDTATRVNSAGLIEKVRTNLVLQSQDFTTSWPTNASPTVTANTTVAPDGTTTADTIASSGASSGVYQITTVASGVEYSFSVYVKNITSATSIQIGCDLNPSNGNLYFDAVTGEITFISAGITGSSVTSVGNGWYRVSGTYISSGTTNTFIVFGQSGMSFAVWGAQLEAGVTTDYIATTSSAVSVGPVANVPRLDYLGSSCPRLLLEPQRTNTQINSERFSAWLGIDNVTIGSNTTDTLDPAGYNGADKITLGSGAPLRVYEFTGSSAGVGTISLFVKAGTSPNIGLFTSSSSLYVEFNLSTQVVTPITGTGTITSYGNGWYRITATSTLASNEVLQILFTGSNGQTIYIWGAQVEAGSYATSYIPTLGAAVTRGADAAFKTSASALIGQTEGTIFAEFQYYDNIAVGSNQYISPLTISNGGFTEAVYFEIFNDSLSAIVFKNSALQAAITKLNLTSGTHRAALAYKQNDIAFYLDGVLVGTDSSADISSAMSQINLATIGASTNLDQAYTQTQALLFKTRLSNADLAALTA